MFNKKCTQELGAKMILFALDDILDYDTRKTISRRLRKLQDSPGRQAGRKRTPLKKLLDNDKSARSFFTSGEFEDWATLCGMEYDWVLSLYRERL